jgi:hypothetical protein
MPAFAAVIIAVLMVLIFLGFVLAGGFAAQRKGMPAAQALMKEGSSVRYFAECQAKTSSSTPEAMTHLTVATSMRS